MTLRILIGTMENNNLINVDITLKTKNDNILVHICRVIGEGKTSTVYLVSIADTYYALKIQSDDVNESVFNKTNNCICLPHIYHYGTINVRDNINISHGTLMEYYENARPLTKIMFKNSEMLSTGTVFRIGLILLRSLKSIHMNGMEYIDLRPPNIACIRNNKTTTFRLYDVDAIRFPSKSYTEKVGKQHESFYSCFEKKHTYIDDLCSLIFVLITMLGGTFWSFKNISTVAEQSPNGNPFFTRFNQLNNSENNCDRNYNKYDVSPFKNEYRRLINCIKVNVYNKIVGDIKELLNVNVDHKSLKDLIFNNFHTIHIYLCKKYLTTTEIKYKSIIGLYILAIFLTECSYIRTECSHTRTECSHSQAVCSHSRTDCSQQQTNCTYLQPYGRLDYRYVLSSCNVDTSIHDFIESKLRYLNVAKIQNLDNIMLYYDHKVNLQLFNIDDLYK